ncbi:hypothetical protein [Streptomyces sp. NPDC005955]|uniref:hypothetical protein n=1 Tax=Streptomyces sp. NPDC005955 TaxID=3364738 RepID=UPI00369CE0B6
MTQSGQGEDAHPSPARRPHEGIVLPADGSGPLLPPGSTPPGSSPAPWGAPLAGPPPPVVGWDTAQPAGYGAGPLPPENGAGAPPAGPDAQATAMLPPVPSDPHAPPPYPPAPAGAHPGFPPATPGVYPATPGGFPPAAGGFPAAAGDDAPATQYLPPVPAGPGPGGPSPLDAAPTELIAPIPAAPGPGPGLGSPDAQATQLIPPVPAAPDGDAEATRFIAPVPSAPGGHLDATQVIPPVQPGALPPEIPTGTPPPGARGPAEDTHYLGAAPPDVHNAPTQHLPQVPPAPPGAPFGIRPGTPGERPPPSEFDALFRDGSPGAGQPGRPQPGRAQPPGPRAPRPAPPGPGAPHPGAPPHGAAHAAAPHQGRAANRRAARPSAKRSKVPLLVAIGVALVVIGVGTGALLGGDGEGDPSGAGTDSTPVSATESTGGEPSEAAPSPSTEAPDEAGAQAKALDGLLADSGGSRATVISAVADINRCEDLDDAADDLREAARERNDLVTRLGELSVDALPRHAELTGALNSAWKASAEADEHYADWADRVRGKKGCRGGKARQTKEAGAGNRASGEATEAKKKASRLWNSIAAKYDLTPRQPTQL